MSPRTSNNAFVFPLYLYPGTDRRDLFAHLEPAGRQPNLNPEVVAALAAAYGRQPAPEEIFAHDHVLQILGLIWIVVFGIGVYFA